MERFAYRRAADVDSALRAVRGTAQHADQSSEDAAAAHYAAQFIAGGTNMTDYMTLGVLRPSIVVDINRLPAARYAQIESGEQRLRFGALVRMSQAEDHPLVRSRYPVIHDTLALAASRQIRNMASLGGNVLQRTRCEYFRGSSWECNKRVPGSGCAALEGLNRQHAVLGTSGHCIAAYAGDFAQALIALDASVTVVGGSSGGRTIGFAELHRLPGDTPHLETALRPGELITFIDIPAGPWTARSCYVKIRDRQSYQFALASAAVALHMEGNKVLDARIALGGVATVPWRAREAEAVLRGALLDETVAAKAADAAFASARTRAQNAFKVPVGKQTIVRALLEAQAMKV
ncbi:MAG: FAD binding domain-containing protein [Steroidobacteraceae bacterium]